MLIPYQKFTTLMPDMPYFANKLDLYATSRRKSDNGNATYKRVMHNHPTVLNPDEWEIPHFTDAPHSSWRPAFSHL